jgi:Do/DeqQ family serine protease
VIRRIRAVLALAAVFSAGPFLPAPAETVPETGADSAREIVPESMAEMQLSFAPLVRKATPAVVNIYATTFTDEGESPYAGDPMLSKLFNELRNPEPQVENSLGSGVILSADGLVVSNYHVVGQADQIRVVLSDRREFDAEIVLTDEESDLAVVRLRGASDLPVLEFADSDRAEVGALVLAIGNPFGVGQTVSSGIISGLGRSTLSEGSERGYFLQTDAPINPGNSGGALIDMEGRLLGINTAILTRDGGSNGVGFAIPARLVAAVMAQAAAGASRFTRPFVGMTGQPVDAEMAEALGLDRPQGVMVAELHPDSPFAAAGLAPGDVILALDTLPVHSPPEVDFRLAVVGQGSAIPVLFLRDGVATETTVALTVPAASAQPTVTVTDDVPLRGLTVQALDPDEASELGLPPDVPGVIVTEARDRAARMGLRPGDLLFAINGMELTDPETVPLIAAMGRRSWTLDVFRDGEVIRLRGRS